ncbi:MAG: SH3 domain-containing protein, partial [Candidatus Paceibacteria bacterium]
TQDAGKRGRLRIREHPSINAPIAGLAPDGATVVFLQGKRYYKPRHDWYPVSVKNIYGNRIEGYAAGKYLC